MGILCFDIHTDAASHLPRFGDSGPALDVILLRLKSKSSSSVAAETFDSDLSCDDDHTHHHDTARERTKKQTAYCFGFESGSPNLNSATFNLTSIHSQASMNAWRFLVAALWAAFVAAFVAALRENRASPCRPRILRGRDGVRG